jgi:endonuclease/exonuclease/phosphatase family metal-dependent hydrolase
MVLRVFGSLLLTALSLAAAETFRVATYNLNNYLLTPAGSRPIKTAESKAKVREALRAMNADVVALQEVGGREALQELRTSLEQDGLGYTHWEHVTAYDTNIQVAIMSRFPIIARKPYTNDTFLLYGRRMRVGRGFAEVQIQVNSNYVFTLITTHLKSKVPVPEGDQAELREQEAILLRQKIDALLKASPDMNLVVLGDLNDTKDSPAIRTVMGKGRSALVDTRPAERNGDDPPRITWTHHYAKEDTYSRVDYILLSRGMAREWDAKESLVVTLPNWGMASDHRPVLATFYAENK